MQAPTVTIALLAAGKSVLCILARIEARMLVELVFEVEVQAAANLFELVFGLYRTAWLCLINDRGLLEPTKAKRHQTTPNEAKRHQTKPIKAPRQFHRKFAAFFSALSLIVSFVLSGIEAVLQTQCGDDCSRGDILGAVRLFL